MFDLKFIQYFRHPKYLVRKLCYNLAYWVIYVDKHFIYSVWFYCSWYYRTFIKGDTKYRCI